MENKTQDKNVTNDSSDSSTAKGCFYALLIFASVVGIMVAIKVFLM